MVRRGILLDAGARTWRNEPEISEGGRRIAGAGEGAPGVVLRSVQGMEDHEGEDGRGEVRRHAAARGILQTGTGLNPILDEVLRSTAGPAHPSGTPGCSTGTPPRPPSAQQSPGPPARGLGGTETPETLRDGPEGIQTGEMKVCGTLKVNLLLGGQSPSLLLLDQTSRPGSRRRESWRTSSAAAGSKATPVRSPTGRSRSTRRRSASLSWACPLPLAPA